MPCIIWNLPSPETKPVSPALGGRFLSIVLPLSFSGLSVGIVVSLDDDKVVTFRVDDEFPGCVLQWKGYLIEDSTQLLQRQNPMAKGKELIGHPLTAEKLVLKGSVSSHSSNISTGEHETIPFSSRRLCTRARRSEKGLYFSNSHHCSQ